MDTDLNQHIDALIKSPATIRQIRFATDSRPASGNVQKADFPRLDIMLDGQLHDAGIKADPPVLSRHDVLFIHAGGWHSPRWQSPCTVLSIVFGKQQLELTLTRWNGSMLNVEERLQVPRRGPRTGSFLLQALNEMQMQPQEQHTARYIVISLLSHCADLLGSQVQTASRSQALFEAIRKYIDARFAEPLTRESVAQEFYLSPNYLSHLFQKCGPMGFNEYLNHIRLEQARMLLKGHDMKIKDVAHACGFVDSNYFCRLFRKNTERSPSEYRRQYHSQMTEKPR
ncbi:helix-turn-helix transcriptional regulator [Raoultella ornithinolytica]|uniref:helix-turn-helix transcriptional regulator n=1 Tax=Raoultella ornithinolytica TaxID=54291 RepID=UPI0002CCF23F|nr:helix-turn-helix domain-containing protein [Raoultella ornithinolytica]AGJ88301.1 AraC family transcriptional regulator [Raoultella ornithinolytica B6]ATM23475.1 AraC family transcriptional regulator [Raoultella ornithinolytica]MEB5727872.1 AraC family transcriptional regulator [Raoultella ornithinolytica]